MDSSFLSRILERSKSKEFVQQFALWSSAAALSYLVYWQFLGKAAENDRKTLEARLIQAEKTVRELEQRVVDTGKSKKTVRITAVEKKEKSASTTIKDGEQSEKATEKPEKKEIRLWMDGAFDMMHYGHMNAFRQARALGTYLIAGVNSDETITACKGRPVCNDKERVDTVRGCKWVDEVVEGVPYIMNDEYLLHVIEKYNIDYIVHGDDPCLVDGKNVYESAVKLGKYLTIPRTEGISTTDIVGRMLMMTCAHHEKQPDAPKRLVDMEYGNKLVGYLGQSYNSATDTEDSDNEFIRNHLNNSRKSNFLTTSHKLRCFGAGVKPPTPGQRVVYIAGAWDMFHAGHIETLQKARALGDYLIVGVHNDQEVNTRHGMNLPILNLNERVLSVLGCKWVDDVLIDAPYVINQDMISSLKISTVVQPLPASLEGAELPPLAAEEVDPFELPRAQGILQHVFITYNISALDFVERIQDQRDRFAVKFAKKAAAEEEFYKNKYSL